MYRCMPYIKYITYIVYCIYIIYICCFLTYRKEKMRVDGASSQHGYPRAVNLLSRTGAPRGVLSPLDKAEASRSFVT